MQQGRFENYLIGYFQLQQLMYLCGILLCGLQDVRPYYPNDTCHVDFLCFVL